MNQQETKKVKKKLLEMKEDLFKRVQEIKKKEEETLGDTVGDNVDFASSSQSREILYELSDTERQILEDINITLKKMEEKKFSICEKCEKKIEAKRLKAIPYARLCLKCKTQAESAT